MCKYLKHILIYMQKFHHSKELLVQYTFSYFLHLVSLLNILTFTYFLFLFSGMIYPYFSLGYVGVILLKTNYNIYFLPNRLIFSNARKYSSSTYGSTGQTTTVSFKSTFFTSCK